MLQTACRSNWTSSHCADSRDMRHLPDNSVHLMITSPPYNVGKEYDADLTLAEYTDLLSRCNEGGLPCPGRRRPGLH